MKKSRQYQAPVDLSTAVRVGRKAFEKQILPIGTITYKGQTIKFDHDYLTDLATAYKDRAFDQVPIVFANEQNAHNMDPKNFGGAVTDMVVKDDGLYIRMDPTRETRKALRDNPNLGVSARIIEQLDKADGRHYDRAVNHVLLTMDPRVTGMKPWQTVDLSSDVTAGRVINLTALTIEKETDMGKKQSTPVLDKKGDGDVITIDLSTLSEKDRKFLTELDLSEVDADEDLDDEDADDDADDADEDDDESDDDADDADDTKDLSNKAPKKRTIDLASAALVGEQGAQIQQMRIDLANQTWESERERLTRDGVPPFLLDLAAPILSSPDAMVIDLSNTDEPVNATEVVRSMLEGIKGMVDLSDESGHQIDLSSDEKDSDADLLKAWDQEYGVA